MSRASTTLTEAARHVRAVAGHGDGLDAEELHHLAELLELAAGRALQTELELAAALAGLAMAGDCGLPDPVPLPVHARSLPTYLGALSRVISGSARRGQAPTRGEWIGLEAMVASAQSAAVSLMAIVRERDELLAVAEDLDVIAAPAASPAGEYQGAEMFRVTRSDNPPAAAFAVPPGSNVVPMPVVARPTARVIPIRGGDEGGAA